MFGRKLPMFLPALGGLLSSIVYILVVSFQSLGVEWLCLASFLSGGKLAKASTLTDSVPSLEKLVSTGFTFRPLWWGDERDSKLFLLRGCADRS